MRCFKLCWIVSLKHRRSGRGLPNYGMIQGARRLVVFYGAPALMICRSFGMWYRGDRALVGARPIALGEERRWGDQFRYYLQEKSGVTGPWQVTYRNSADYRRRLVLQRHYLNSWTPVMDIKCLLRTLTVPFERKNAY